MRRLNSASCAKGKGFLPWRSTVLIPMTALLLLLLLSEPKFTSGQTATGAETKSSENLNVCKNAPSGIGHSGQASTRYKKYRDKYTNCTYLDGSLEIVFLDEKDDYDLSFLSNIREITGYVLIVAVNAKKIPLTSLRIIRGRPGFPHNGTLYSIYVAVNFKNDAIGIGLQELGLISLREVIQGHVFFQDNRELCHEDTIEWKDILPKNYSAVFVNFPKRRKCQPCDESCRAKDNKTHCWGPGPSQCQNMTKLFCSPQCDGRCRGDQVKDCCAQECAVGCTGPTKADCLECKNFANDGLCELSCPRPEIYIKETYTTIPNPDFKYSYQSLCVKSCPSHYIASKDSCVTECEAGFLNVNGKCEKCVGPCPKTCSGTDAHGINADNIESFRNCTIIQGNIRILNSAFEGDEFLNISKLKFEDLFALESVQEVSGFIQIQAHHADFKNLSFLRNLKKINGMTVIAGKSTSFEIYDTKLESLDLVSLTTISNGNIVVANNSRLCFAEGLNWSRLAGSQKTKVIMRHNRNATECALEGSSCSLECSGDGCWGPRDDQCFLECAHFRLEEKCISSCSALPLIYRHNDKECKRCHPQCKSNCSNNLSSSCDECLNVKDGPYCLPTCPQTKYPDLDNICQLCHGYCDGGCTGSRNSIGAGACNSCSVGRFANESSHEVVECLAPGSECEDGFYKIGNLRQEYGPMKGKQGCFRCHGECLKCDGPNNLDSCLECRHYRQERECVPQCSSHHYLSINKSSGVDSCLPCHSRCLKCTGPRSLDCVLCKEYLVYLDPVDRNKGFDCMEKCPDEYPDKMTEVTESGDIVTVCFNDEANRIKKTAIMAGCIVGGIVITSIFVVIIIVIVKKRAKTKETQWEMSKKITGLDGQLEPVSPSGEKPDLSQIRIIKESELRRGGILGSGAFGTVFKGLWFPENDDCKMIVAIKVLSGGTTPNQNEELISEARIMASVESDFCIRILAFCMASQMMIITELMPLGCLLDFVRKYKKYIGSRLILQWCTQIAQGMAYLEDIKIVHRDLAARNVLVQSADHVRITDFGLSKLRDYNENEVTHTGGKMPIKWLALESIQHKRFTHYSDVWSYGVTLWELFTYGQRPYESVDARNMAEMLEKGERLPHPSMCTMDVYMILVKCWRLQADQRPSFRSLADQFSKMALNSSHFLIIENDGKMSLPEFSYNEVEVLRSLSVNDPDGPEKIVSPDDYLKPVSTTQRRPNSVTSDQAIGSDFELRRVKKPREEKNPSEKMPNDDRRKNSRYCSDPCKTAFQVFPPHGNKIHDYGNFPSPYGDDYLLPKQSGPPVKYLDLANDTDSDNQIDETLELQSLNQHSADPAVTSSVSNPEYFDMPNTLRQVHPATTAKQRQYHNYQDDERKRPLLWNNAPH